MPGRPIACTGKLYFPNSFLSVPHIIKTSKPQNHILIRTWHFLGIWSLQCWPALLSLHANIYWSAQSVLVQFICVMLHIKHKHELFEPAATGCSGVMSYF